MARGTRRPRGSHAIEAGKRARYDVTLRTLRVLRMLRRNFVMWHTFALLALFTSVQGRAVNISNTWVLPEEGFPVFYRYFRDRISWYEADAVCQFHHANLVTVDTTAQYDAVRAYLKELDISSAVWVGLIRSNPDGDFTWTDYRGLSGDGYWSSAPDARAAPLCAAADPAADYRWEARACGGPTVASFICELPVPQWALGNEGCMVRALPALTILYLPESAAVQLTADCGLAGVKRVQCTGNVKREDLLKDLSCAEEEEPSSTFNSISTSVTYSVTTDAAFTDQDTTNEVTTEENITTEHEDDVNQSKFIKSTPLPYIVKSLPQSKLSQKPYSNKDFLNHNINLPIDIIHDNNLHSNEIPKIASENSFLINEHIEKLEDEKNMQHKMLHDEIARLGNLETIFTQPTDHFVPPLVMARSKISDDMTVLSLEEKHAQKLAEQGKHKILHDKDTHEHIEYNNGHSRHTTEDISTSVITDSPIIITVNPIKFKDNQKKDKIKSIVPKKYNDKQFDPKSKVMKTEIKTTKVEKATELPTYTYTEHTAVPKETTPTNVTSYDSDKSNSDEDPTIDLTVIIKDPPRKNINTFTGDVPKIEVIENDTYITNPEIKLTTDNTTGNAKQEISVKIPAQLQNLALTHEVIKITIINEENSSIIPTVFEITTKMPVFDDIENISSTTVFATETTTMHNENNKSVEPINVRTETTKDDKLTKTTMSGFTTVSTLANTKTEPVTETDVSTTEHLTTTTQTHTFSKAPTNITDKATSTTESIITTVVPITTKESSIMTTEIEDLEKNTTVIETIDDFQSPLLSAANEPLHRPSRTRRPQQPNRLNKFNPFRILG